MGGSGRSTLSLAFAKLIASTQIFSPKCERRTRGSELCQDRYQIFGKWGSTDEEVQLATELAASAARVATRCQLAV